MLERHLDYREVIGSISFLGASAYHIQSTMIECSTPEYMFALGEEPWMNFYSVGPSTPLYWIIKKLLLRSNAKISF